MRFPFCILVVLAAMFSAQAEKPFPAEVPAKLEPESVAFSKLPEGLRARMMTETFENDQGERPDSFRVLKVDLNNDGEPEMMVWEPKRFTGGDSIYIFSSESTGFQPLGFFQGSFYLSKAANGYAQIVTTARAGGGIVTRMLLQCGKEGYQVVRATDYRVSGDREVFVEEQNPANFR